MNKTGGHWNKRGIRLILSGPDTQLYFLTVKSGFLDRLGEENIAGDSDDALAKARLRSGRPEAAV